MRCRTFKSLDINNFLHKKHDTFAESIYGEFIIILIDPNPVPFKTDIPT